MKRVKFKFGKQREFLKKVLENLDCPSLRAIKQFGFDIPYSTLKNYYIESRNLPYDFFRDLCYVGKIDIGSLNVEFLSENHGQIIGGKTKKNL